MAAVDAGCPALSSVSEVDVTVVDVAGGPPVFQTTPADGGPPTLTLVTSVPEDAPVGHVVYTCRALNPAGPDRLRYHWLANASRGYDVRGQPIADQNYLQVGCPDCFHD